MIYTLKELSEKISPIARKYDIPTVYIFGSYARGDATDDSDVDVLIQRKGSKIVTMFDMGGLYNDLDEKLCKSLDLVTLEALEQEDTKQRTPWFADNLLKERRLIYAKS
ncbi:MAG: nucleotidyltransferase domain-containing protein [Oscillospiraceae bacterium]|nr:nucleotidyltransferase domain-containing protein [Oscillospiraceae bacterium]